MLEGDLQENERDSTSKGCHTVGTIIKGDWKGGRSGTKRKKVIFRTSEDSLIFMECPMRTVNLLNSALFFIDFSIFAHFKLLHPESLSDF